MGLMNAITPLFAKYSTILFSGDPKIIGIYEVANRITSFITSVLSYFSSPIFSLAVQLNGPLDKLVLDDIVKKSSLKMIMISFLLIFTLYISSNFWYIRFFNDDLFQYFYITLFFIFSALIFSSSEAIQKMDMARGGLRRVYNVKFKFTVLYVIISLVFLKLNIFNVEFIFLLYSFYLLAVSFYWFFRYCRSL
jgi:O-antigen/teichoic acid export membrane protein